MEIRQSSELAVDRIGAGAGQKLQSGFIYATQPGGAARETGLNAVNVKPPAPEAGQVRPPSTQPDAIVTISQAGRDALAAAQPSEHSLRSPAPALKEANNYAMYSIQKALRVATGDSDGDGRSDVAASGPPATQIVPMQRSKHDAMMAAIQNTR